MKREVAEEWMNRYLDGDLSEEDADILFRHIDNNPDAADTFRIMSALSLQLEKLPDVTPKFSLVDSILPKLDDIDAERRAEIASDIGIMEPQLEDKDEFTERRKQRRTWRDRLPVRTIGGLVAAGVILGVSIATYEPKTMTDAGQAPSNVSMEQQAADQETGAAKSSAEEDATLQAPETTTPESTSPESKSEPQSTVSPESATPNQQVTPSDQTTPETGTGTSQNTTPSSGNKGGIPPAGSESTPESSTQNPSSDAGTTSEDQPMKQQQIAPDTESSSTNDSSSATTPDSATSDSSSSDTSKSTTDSSSQDATSDSNSSSTVAPKTSTDASSNSSKDSSSSSTPESETAPKTYSLAPETDSKAKEDSQARSFSTNAVQQDQEWLSPNGQYAVVLTTANVLRLDSLSVNNLNGRTVVATATIDGTWISGQWTKDNKAFNYQLEKDGKTKWYKLSTAGL